MKPRANYKLPSCLVSMASPPESQPLPAKPGPGRQDVMRVLKGKSQV